MATKNFPYPLWGITAPQYRHPSGPRANLDINSKEDDKPVRINSRDYDQTTGETIGGQTKPNQVATMTNGSVIGWEFSPRVNDAGLGSSGALIGLRADPILKTATSARTVGSVRCIESNPSLPGSGSAYTITNLDGWRIFLDKGSGHTVTTASVIRVATPNTSGWDFLLALEASSGINPAVKTAAAISHTIPIKSGSTTFYLMVSDTQ